LNKAAEVLDVILPSGDEAAEVVLPGEEPFHFPATAITTELPFLSLASRCRSATNAALTYLSDWFYTLDIRAVGSLLAGVDNRHRLLGLKPPWPVVVVI
jgi:hypothetical protein